MATTILAYSGGLAATGLLWQLRHAGERVHCLYIDHGQPAAGMELAAAERIVSQANTHRRSGEEVDLSCVTISGFPPSLLPTHGQVRRREFEHYGLTVLAVTAARGLTCGAATLACGVRIDRGVVGFDAPAANLVGLLMRKELALYLPYQERELSWILSRAHRLGAPIRDTWSCLVGGQKHCGTCRGCKARRAAFDADYLEDYTLYASEPVILRFASEAARPKGPA
jgi:7-cyano-7-deazaguanine synthase